MISTAKLRYLRIAPRKVRLVADLIRGEKVEKAQNILIFTRKKAAKPILKLLNQAVVNAKSKDLKFDESNLFISKIFIDEGPKNKRTLPRARGRADIIHKKTSHITIVLDEVKGAKKKKLKGKRKEKAVRGGKDAKKKDQEIEKYEDKKELEDKEKILADKKREKEKWKMAKERLKPKTKGALRKFFRRKAI